MKIISKFRDYYDKEAMYGVDHKYCYVRNTIDPQEIWPEIPLGIRRLSDGWEVIGVCGDIYVNRCGLLDKETYKYDYQRDRWGRPDDRKKMIKLNTDNRRYRRTFLKNEYERILANNHIKSLFESYQVPLFLIRQQYGGLREDENMASNPWTVNENNWRHTAKIILNPNLKDLKMSKRMSPQKMFTKIEFFIANNLQNKTPEHEPFTDNEKRNSKGFDSWSFKRQKDKRKRKQKGLKKAQ